MQKRPQLRARSHARSSAARIAVWIGATAGLALTAAQAEPVLPSERGAGSLSPADLVASGLDAVMTPAVGALSLHTPPTPAPPRLQISEGELGRGETLARALGREGISPQLILEITHTLAPHFDFRSAQPGHKFRIARGPQGELVDFEYLTAPNTGWHIQRSGDGYEVTRREAHMVPRTARIAGLVSDNLYGAIADLGEDGQLAHDYADVFAWDIDFHRAIRSGDAFEILYERLYRVEPDGNEKYSGPGRILAARYDGAAGHYEAVYFETEKGRGGYYHPDGSSVEGQFLMSPVWHGRVTSPYSDARFHPILKITRPHHGIDYAAPEGTPVWAVADGVVTYRDWGGGFGNLVKIRHRTGVESFYAHLSRYAKDLRVGQTVRQKQVIGYVGSTGLATGPHVCFRFSKDGRYVNPANVRGLATREPIPSSLRGRFQVARDMLLAQLEGNRQVARETTR
ncbi:MAG TPA: M23 family metallopeptidase [Myxococcota bacterium]|nr:M23 family metallopeptidase [Myxococcota bacterium]